MEQETFPTTVEELVKSKWPNLMRYTIAKYATGEEVEDTMQDILTTLHERKYLERWDQSKGASWYYWLFKLIHNTCKGKYNRRHSKAGRRIQGTMSLDVDLKDGYGLVDILPGTSVSPDFLLRFQEAVDILSGEEFGASSSNVYDGVRYDRDPKTIFLLMVVEGLTPKDVKERLDTSSQFVYMKLKIIRKVVRDVF